MILWRIILEYFVAGNIVSNTLSRFPLAPNKQYEPSTVRSKFHVGELFVTSWGEIHYNYFPIKISLVHKEQQQKVLKMKVVAYI